MSKLCSAIHTPACLWRRTGEIYKANKEFSVLTGIPSALLRGGKIGIYELMTEESMVRYYQVSMAACLLARMFGRLFKFSYSEV